MAVETEMLAELAGIKPPALEHLFDMTAQLAPAQQIGDIGRGTRLIVPALSGTISGPRLRGRVLPPGGDWLTLRADGTGELDVRITLETDDGAHIFMSYHGYLTNVPAVMPRWGAGETIPDQDTYFRTTPYFETSAPQYAWLMQTVALAVGRLIPGGVAYRVFTAK